jgi:hypothetical protein
VEDFSTHVPRIESKVKEGLENLERTSRHLNDIYNRSRVSQEREIRFMTWRSEALPEENAPLPIKMLPKAQNELFFGREAELEAINAKLGKEEINSLETYTIYGRRGVGKTHIALEYAYQNRGKFDAIFWIQCETSASLRQSINSTAIELNLPGASQSGHYEENLVYVLQWLRTTRARWLLVFDNAEKEKLLKGYWPHGARGSILITSRKYYNLIKDIRRGGETVPTFNEDESQELLLMLLDQSWQERHLLEPFRESDLAAGRALMREIGGLALAIEQAAKLITKQDRSLRGFLDLFMAQRPKLPVRQLGTRDRWIQSLDTIWSIAFDELSTNARALLGVLAFLAPEGIQVDLFLPRDQKCLRGRLEFCMTKSSNEQEEAPTALANVIEPPPALQNVIDELENAKLIEVDNRRLSIHRVIQEALSYQDFADLQASFDTAVRLVHEAFPKQHPEILGPMHEAWPTCQEYVQHAVQLFAKFEEYGHLNIHSEGGLQAPEEFVILGGNCGW